MEEPMTDEAIADEIARRGLEVLYLRELAAALGFAEEEGWSEALFTAIDGAAMDDRRRAALRVIHDQDELDRQVDPDTES